MRIQKVMVIGAGQMGSGIAQVCAQAGFDVVLNDMKQEFFERGIGVISKNLSRDVEKGRKTEEEKATILGRITMCLWYVIRTILAPQRVFRIMVVYLRMSQW